MSWAVLLAAAPALTSAGIQVVREVRTQRQAKQTRESIAKQASRPRGAGAPRPGRVSALPDFTREQRESLAIIAKETRSSPLLTGYLHHSRSALTLGLWVNAWHESRLRQDAYNGANEDSVGLFQINRRAHKGHSREDLKNGHYNTRYMLELVSKERRFQEILSKGASIEVLTAAITLWVERPKDREVKAVQRAETLRRWFPELASEQAFGWEYGGQRDE